MPIGDRPYRFALTADEIPGMRAWWHRYYRGLLAYRSDQIRADRAAVML